MTTNFCSRWIHVISHHSPLYIDLGEGSKLRANRERKFKRDPDSLESERESTPPRIISVQTRRNRSSDRFNLPDSRTPWSQRRRNLVAIAWARKEEGSPGFSNCRSHSFLSRNNGTDAPTLCSGGWIEGRIRGGPRVSWGYFQSIIRPGVGSTPLIVCPDKEKSALLVGPDGISRGWGWKRMVGSTT